MTKKQLTKSIKAALVKKHQSHVNIVECPVPNLAGKGSCGRIDVWTLITTPYKERAIGFEIKVDKCDLIQDHKYPRYFPYCHEFYFVITPDLLDCKELPDGVGIITYCRGNKRDKLRVVREAACRDVAIPASFFQRVLRIAMSGKTYWKQVKRS